MRAGEKTQRQRKVDAERRARAQMRYRQAEVLDLDPITVAPGGGGSVPCAIQEGVVVEVGDAVDCIETDGVLLVIGRSELTAPDWTTLTLAANWTGTVEFRRVGDRVELRGAANRASGVTNLVATLPAGYRPPVDLYPLAATNSGGGGVGVLEIATNGQLHFYDFGLFATQTSGSTDGISFSTTA